MQRAVADGIYKTTSLEAHVTPGGKRLNLPIRALRIKMSGRYKWMPATVEMRTTLDSTIRDGILVMDAPLNVSVLKIKAKGKLRMTGSLH